MDIYHEGIHQRKVASETTLQGCLGLSKHAQPCQWARINWHKSGTLHIIFSCLALGMW